jgi:hypothetical protein
MLIGCPAQVPGVARHDAAEPREDAAHRREKPLTPYRLGIYNCSRNGFSTVPANDLVRNI